MSESICLHIVRNSVSHDSRVLKETGSLIKNNLFKKVEIAGFFEEGYLEEEWIDKRYVRRFRLKTRSLPKSLIFQFIKYVEWLFRLLFVYAGKKVSVIHCHDLGPLPIAVVLKCFTGAKLVYDAHEFETETYGKTGIRKYLSIFTERLLIRFTDKVITVSPSIKKWYEKQYQGPVTLLRNIPDISDSEITAKSLKKELGIPSESLLFLYLGNLSQGRGIENILQSFAEPTVKHHVLFLGNGSLFEQVFEASQKYENIHHLKPVPPEQVISYAKGADIGLCLYEDTCLNYRYCLPNKLFESILSGIPVLSSNLPDQASFVREFDAGWVVDNNVASICEFLRNLGLVDVKAMGADLGLRVKGLSWQSESRGLIDLYRSLGHCE